MGVEAVVEFVARGGEPFISLHEAPCSTRCRSRSDDGKDEPAHLAAFFSSAFPALTSDFRRRGAPELPWPKDEHAANHSVSCRRGARRNRPFELLRLKQCENSAVRICYGRETAEVFDVKRARQDVRAKFPGLFGAGGAVVRLEIEKPVRWDVRLTVFDPRDATDELLAVADVQVPGFTGGQMPAEEARVELRSDLDIGCGKVRPAEGAMLPDDADTFVAFRLPEGKRRAGGIENHGHSAGIQYIKRTGADFSAHLNRAAYRLIGAFHGNVESPVWWHIASALIRTERPGGSNSAVPQAERCIESGRADQCIIRTPAEEACVEDFCRGLVGGRQFHPAEGTWSVFLDERHVGACIRIRQSRAGRGRE